MNGKALGIIETVGLVPAVEAGDVAVKTADVRLIGFQAVGGGLVSILMKGDVSAVKASIDAGSTAAARLGEVISVTVIARTAEGLEGILIEEGKRLTSIPGPKATGDDLSERAFHLEVASDKGPASVDGPVYSVAEAKKAAPIREGGDASGFDMADLKKMKVTKLRRLARQLPTFSITRGEIKYAKKKDLIEAFTKYMKTLNP